MMLHFPTPVYIRVHAQTHVLTFPHHTFTQACVCMDVHMCAHRCSHLCTHAHTHTHSHMHTHPYVCTHSHGTRSYSMCIPVHMHRLPPTRMHTHTHVPIRTHAYISPHRLPHPRTSTHVCTRVHTRTCTHCTSCCRPCFSHHHEECDVSESLLTLLPLLQPCSRPDRDVVRRGRPAPGQYLELLSSVAC